MFERFGRGVAPHRLAFAVGRLIRKLVGYCVRVVSIVLGLAGAFMPTTRTSRSVSCSVMERLEGIDG
jgi:hypothetical protein